MKVPVKEFMSQPVVTTTVDSNVAYVRELMERKDVSAIPVVELREGYLKVRGIVTRYDLSGITDERLPVTEVMSDELQVISSDTPAIKAASLMIEHGIHHLVVMEKGRLSGIVSSMDFVRLFSEKKLRHFASVIFV